MRIAFVAHHGSVHTQRWAAFFADRGHDVHVITCGDGGPRQAGYEVHDLGAPRPRKAGYLLRLRAARRVAYSVRPDLVHAHYATSYGLLGLSTGVQPLIVTAHGSDLLVARHNPALRWVLRRVLRAAALVTVPSDEMREAVHTLVGPAVPVETFQYGVETSRLLAIADAQRASPASGASPLTIVAARPLRRLYRNDVVLDGLSALARTRQDWQCRVFGDGPERAGLERQAIRLGLGSRVAFLGHRPATEVEEALASAHLYASFSESDGASIALLEAMTLGAVPVVSDIRSNRFWISDGVNGVLSPIDPAAAGAAFDRALSLDRDQVAAKNRSLVVERADRERNLGALERRLQELVDLSRAQAPWD